MTHRCTWIENGLYREETYIYTENICCWESNPNQTYHDQVEIKVKEERNCEKLPVTSLLSRFGATEHVQTNTSDLKFCQVSIRPHNFQHSSLWIIQKKSVFILRGFPQQLHQRHSLAPVMRFESPTSPKPEMKNDDIKERWKYFSLTIETRRLGKCSRTAIQSQPSSSFFFFLNILWTNLTLHLVHVVSVVFSCDIIPPTRGSI